MTRALVLCMVLAGPALAAADAGLADAGTLDAGHIDVSAPLEVELPRAEPPGVAGAEDLDVGWALVRTMVVLGLVVVLAYVTLNVGMRKLLGIRPVSNAGVVHVIERVALDQKRSLFVVEAAGEVLLLGGAEAGVTLISKLDAAEVGRRRAEGQQARVQLSPLLQKLLGKKAAEKS